MGTNPRPNAALRNGVGWAIREAYPIDSVIDSSLESLIHQVDGKYLPDEAADERASRLLGRLKQLPWDDGV